MKRSEINAIIRDADAFLRLSGFYLPPFAYWTPEDWQSKRKLAHEIIDRRLGWDVTDFGQGDYRNVGLCVFTLRNGSPENLTTHRGKTYAEKILIVDRNQVTPMHFHRVKMEDIINRGGGNLVVQLYNSTPDEGLDSSDVIVNTDGLKHTIQAGGKVILHPGESITI
ncbi:MAG: D-lyxose/D-mannose family sugar isomerase, partial [Ktedonobacteraceae bacterium]